MPMLTENQDGVKFLTTYCHPSEFLSRGVVVGKSWQVVVAIVVSEVRDTVNVTMMIARAATMVKMTRDC